jgi:hypothetical protein
MRRTSTRVGLRVDRCIPRFWAPIRRASHAAQSCRQGRRTLASDRVVQIDLVWSGQFEYKYIMKNGSEAPPPPLPTHIHLHDPAHRHARTHVHARTCTHSHARTCARAPLPPPPSARPRANTEWRSHQWATSAPRLAARVASHSSAVCVDSTDRYDSALWRGAGLTTAHSGRCRQTLRPFRCALSGPLGNPRERHKQPHV